VNDCFDFASALVTLGKYVREVKRVGKHLANTGTDQIRTVGLDWCKHRGASVLFSLSEFVVSDPNRPFF